MFTNLIESNADRSAFKRRSSFFLATIAVYALVLFTASIAGIYAYDATVEAQTSSLELLEWVPPVKPVPEVVRPETRTIRRATPSNARVDPNVRVAERTAAIRPADDPTKIPDAIGIKASDIPPVRGEVRLTNRNVDPPFSANNNERGCTTCNEAPPVVHVDDTPPPVIPAKPKALPTSILISKVVSMPKPVYPNIARTMRQQGSVNVQILVDEAGKVISARAVNGNPVFIRAAEDAAIRARFTPTILNNQPVKVQGVITYNFVLQ